MSGHTRKMMISGIACLIMFSFLAVDSAFAHKVTIFAWVEGDTVYTESKFSGGRKAKNAPVEVFDARGNKLLEGKTDNNGEFSFKAPRKTELKIVLLAGMGHKAEWTIHAEELEGEISEYAEKSTPHEPAAARLDKIHKAVSASGENASASPCLTSKDIEDAVENALDKKLKPVITKLNRLSHDHGPAASDIIGGIGYIIGLVGIGAYFNYRRKKD